MISSASFPETFKKVYEAMLLSCLLHFVMRPHHSGMGVPRNEAATVLFPTCAENSEGTGLSVSERIVFHDEHGS